MWAAEELADVDLGDDRRALRLMRVVESLAAHGEQSVPQTFGDGAQVRAAYRLWSNPKIAAAAILAPHRHRTAERAATHDVVLAVQDTTEINLSRHPATQGLGYLARSDCRGVLVHTCLALTVDGTPLGVVDQQVWTRPLEELGKRATRKRRPTEEKESRRWLDGLRAAEQGLAGGLVIVIGDRESDCYDLFATPRAQRVQLLVRVAREERIVDHPLRSLRAAIEAEPACGEVQMTLPRRGRVAERTARFDVRRLSAGWPPPKNSRLRAAPLPVQLILLSERATPTTKQPIRWLLATTLPVDDAAAAVRIAGYYARRWQIERFHYVLKSGCSIERLRLTTAANVRRALACFSIVAWRLLWLTTAARTTPDAPGTAILDAAECRALEAVARLKYRRPLAAQPPNLAETVRLLARLGGHLNRKCDGPPGVKTVWRGLSRLADVTIGWLAAQAPG